VPIVQLLDLKKKNKHRSTKKIELSRENLRAVIEGRKRNLDMGSPRQEGKRGLEFRWGEREGMGGRYVRFALQKEAVKTLEEGGKSHRPGRKKNFFADQDRGKGGGRQSWRKKKRRTHSKPARGKKTAMCRRRSPFLLTERKKKV